MEVSEVSYRILADLLEARTGQHLGEGRRWRIATALAGLFREYGISNADQLVCLLQDARNHALESAVIEALLNNETYFFRDRLMFHELAQTVLPDLARKRADTRRLSIWSAGCSTGQEALSLAMLFRNAPAAWRGWTIEILGTDISQQAIDVARRGVYNQFEVQRGLTVQQMLAHFTRTDAGWHRNAELGAMVRYEKKSIFDAVRQSDRFDLILCRNVLLYLTPGWRTLAFDRLAEALQPDGWLWLGAGETAHGRTQHFHPTPERQGLFTKTANYLSSDRVDNTNTLRPEPISLLTVN